MPEIIKTKLRGVTAKNEDGSLRQEIIKDYVHPGDDLTLEREPNNPVDKNAIAVYIEPSNTQKLKVGFLSKELAEKLSSVLDTGFIIVCEVLDTTGDNEEAVGVNCQLEIFSKEEINAYRKQNGIIKNSNSTRKTIQTSKTYRIPFWRASLGLFLLLFTLISLFSGLDSFGAFIVFLVFFVPTLLLLLPWIRWVIDQIIKLITSEKKH